MHMSHSIVRRLSRRQTRNISIRAIQSLTVTRGTLMTLHLLGALTLLFVWWIISRVLIVGHCETINVIIIVM